MTSFFDESGWEVSVPEEPDVTFAPEFEGVEKPPNLDELRSRVAWLENWIRTIARITNENSSRTADRVDNLTDASNLDTFRNFLCNGDFTAKPWPAFAAPPCWTQVGAVVIVAGPPPTGSCGQSVGLSGNSDVGISQAVPICGGKIYTVDFRWFLGGGAAKVVITTNGATPYTRTVTLEPSHPPPNTWEQTPINPEQITFQAPDDATLLTIQLLLNASPSGVSFTDVAVWESSVSRLFTKRVFTESDRKTVTSRAFAPLPVDFLAPTVLVTVPTLTTKYHPVSVETTVELTSVIAIALVTFMLFKNGVELDATDRYSVSVLIGESRSVHLHWQDVSTVGDHVYSVRAQASVVGVTANNRRATAWTWV